jgi:2-keto-myo-inositol isomerase
LAQVVTGAHAASGKMVLSLHQNTSRAAGYRKSLEGWAKAGIKNVELTDVMLDEFLKTDDLAAARRVVTDLGLTPVSCASVLPDFWIPSPNRAAAMETWKKRCDQFSAFGISHIYCPAVTSRKVTADDYKGAVDCIREGGEAAAQYKMTAMIEFARNSSFISTLTTSLKLIREAAHPNVHPMLDCYHFWSGLSKFEDLDLLRPGELAHVHYQDVPDMPRELLDNTTRLIPGDGVSPLVRILRKLSEKGYAGALSVELFLPEFQQGDPYEVARRIREKAEGVMRQAKVI